MKPVNTRCSVETKMLKTVSEGILNLLNHEICCDFTHMIVTDGIDIHSNDMLLCGRYKEDGNG